MFGSGNQIKRERRLAISHPVRRRILEMYTAEPRWPISVEALTAALAGTEDCGEIGPANVKYHRDRLMDAGLLPI